MQLYLVRHAEAAPGDPDDLRPLTSAGRAQARRLGERLRAQGLDAPLVLTSPLLRARETGSLIAEALGAPLAIAEELAPGTTAERLKRAVATAAEGHAAVVAVAHQPDCGRITAALTGAAAPPFPPAGAVAIPLP